jgi:hypothetical protein
LIPKLWSQSRIILVEPRPEQLCVAAQDLAVTDPAAPDPAAPDPVDPDAAAPDPNMKFNMGRF